ncbi:MAG: hypothetical protein D6790_05790 [Caldilineae bacterium]|nr:MAG: hypothetical protein D6790_05790 [Caldilineae bacterium]
MDGLAHLSTGMTVAVESVFGGAGAYPLSWVVLRVLADAMFPLLLAAGGLLLAWSRRDRLGLDPRWLWLLTGWTLWGVLLLLLPGRNPLSLLVLDTAVVLTAGVCVARLLAFGLERPRWQDALLIAATIGVLLVTGYFWTAHYSQTWGEPDFDWRSLLFYAIPPILIAFFVWWAGWRTTAQTLGLVAVALLLYASLAASWRMNAPATMPQEGRLLAFTAQPGVNLLVDDVEKISAIRAGDAHQAPVFIDLGIVDTDGELTSMLAWRLRRMRNLHVGAGPDFKALEDAATMVITPADITPALPDDFVGSHYGVARFWLPNQLQRTKDRVRWLLLRETPAPVPDIQVVLWVRRQ